MNVNEMKDVLTMKANELSESIETMKASGVSPNTIRTQTYQKTHEIHNLMIMVSLLDNIEKDDIEWAGDTYKWFTSATTLTANRVRGVQIEVHEGDKVMDVLQKYSEVKDIYKKIQEACEKAGLKINLDTIIKA